MLHLRCCLLKFTNWSLSVYLSVRVRKEKCASHLLRQYVETIPDCFPKYRYCVQSFSFKNKNKNEKHDANYEDCQEDEVESKEGR